MFPVLDTWFLSNPTVAVALFEPKGFSGRFSSLSENYRLVSTLSRLRLFKDQSIQAFVGLREANAFEAMFQVIY